MIHSPKISVIVPVYKAEKYLHRCVDSILAQTFNDFELLLINDGSPDNSGEICDEYAQKDSRVRVFHKKNEGVSATRQFGVEHSLGDYMIHADPDDWVESNMLLEMYTQAKISDYDLVLCDYYKDSANGIKYCKQQPSSLDHSVVLSELFRKLHGSCCNKLVKRTCFLNYNIKFPSGINYCEDLYVWVILLQNPIKISYLDKAFYHYDSYTNTNSISRNYTIEKYRERRRFYTFLRSNLNEEYQGHCNTLLANIAFETFRHNIFTNSEYRENFYGESKMILRSSTNNMIKYFSFFSSIGFYKISYQVYKLMLNLHKCFKK